MVGSIFHVPPPPGAFLRLFAAINGERRHDIGLELAGRQPGHGPMPTRRESGARQYLYRQGTSLAGGSNEMQRNLISERVLHMPREYTADLDKPFGEVRHNDQVQRSSQVQRRPQGERRQVSAPASQSGRTTSGSGCR